MAYYTYRLPLGLSLTDESYYAVLVVDLLQPDGSTGALVFHRLAALLTEPWLRLHRWLLGDLTGFVLSLRICYAAMSLTAGITIWWTLRGDKPRCAALLCGALPVAFIPFGLPSPSYNTTAMLASLGGLFLLVHALRPVRAQRPIATIVVSAALTALSTIAYPTLLISNAAAGVGLALLTRRTRDHRTVSTWAVITAGFIMLLATVATLRFGPDYWRDSWYYHAAIGAVLHAGDKVVWSLRFLHGQPFFVLFCALGAVAGWVAHRQPRRRMAMAGDAMICALAFSWLLSGRAALIFVGHDLIVFFAVTMLPILIDPFRRSVPPRGRALLVLYSAGWIGGLVTSWTASLALMNFPIGGLVAVVAGFAYRLGESTWPRQSLVTLGTVVAILGTYSIRTVYDDHSHAADASQERLASGPYAGLRTTTTVADVLRAIEAQLTRYRGPARRTILVQAGPPGIYLLTSLRPAGPSTWPFAGAAVNEFLRRYYARPDRRPDLIVEYGHGYGSQVAVTELLEQHYQLIDDEGPLRIYVLVPQSSAQ